jgi:hypothetical protein
MHRIMEIAGENAKVWVEGGMLFSLVLYALFGLSEVWHRYPLAFAALRQKCTGRRIRAVLINCLRVLASLGPLYITFEVLERASAFLNHH